MTWTVVVPDIVAGLFLGAFLALVAVGYSMVYGILRLINFAHGDFYMVAAFVSYTLLAAVTVGTKINWGNVVWVGIVTMIAGGVLAMSVERLVYRPMRRAAVLSVMIAALGVSQVLENGVLNIPAWGSNYLPFPVTPPSTGFNVDGVHYTWTQVVIVAIAAVLIAAVWWIVNRTMLGTAMRAVAQDRVAATLMGINTDRIISLSNTVPAPRRQNVSRSPQAGQIAIESGPNAISDLIIAGGFSTQPTPILSSWIIDPIHPY